MVGTAEIMKLKVSGYMNAVWEMEAGQPCHEERKQSSGVLMTRITDFIRCKTDSLLTYLCSEAGSYNGRSSSKPLSQPPELIYMYHHSKVLFYYLTFKKIILWNNEFKTPRCVGNETENDIFMHHGVSAKLCNK